MSTEIIIVIAAIAVLVGGFVIWRLLAAGEPTKAIEPGKAEPQKAEPQKAKPEEAEPQKAKPEEAEPQKAKPEEAEPPPAASATRADSVAGAEPSAAPEPKGEDSAAVAGADAIRPETGEAARESAAEAAPGAPEEKRAEAGDAEGGGGQAAKEPEEDEQPPLRSVPPPAEVDALRKGLASTRGGFISRLAGLFRKKQTVDPSLLDEIEEVLITADIGVKTADTILKALRERLENGELSNADEVWEALRTHAKGILAGSKGGIRIERQPTVILVVGVNGVGKTTTIGKLASRLNDEGRSVLLAAGDTFRAAAVLQLEVWGRRVGCDVHRGRDRADPASVVFEAVKKGIDEGHDVVIADTAGRLHTKANLMEELKKVSRSVEKALGRPADEILLVLDSTTGQNAIQQAEIFKDALDLSGIVLTKLDGTAKGGVILGIVDEHRIPMRYIGMGERVEDLHEFSASPFVAALFEKPDDESAAA